MKVRFLSKLLTVMIITAAMPAIAEDPIREVPVTVTKKQTSTNNETSKKTLFIILAQLRS